MTYKPKWIGVPVVLVDPGMRAVPVPIVVTLIELIIPFDPSFPVWFAGSVGPIDRMAAVNTGHQVAANPPIIAHDEAKIVLTES
jgi:hypothetical protein